MISLLALFVQKAYAGNAPVIAPIGHPNVGNSDAVALIGTIYTQAFTIITLLAGALAVLYIIYNGVQYITSNGNPEKAKVARQGIINAVIGIAIVVATFFIIRIGITVGNDITTSSPNTPGTNDPINGTGTNAPNHVASFSVSASVVDQTNNPVPNATVSVVDPPATAALNPFLKDFTAFAADTPPVYVNKGMTTATGTLTFNMNNRGTYSISVAATGYKDCNSQLSFTPGAALTIRMAKGTDSCTAGLGGGKPTTPGDGKPPPPGGGDPPTGTAPPYPVKVTVLSSEGYTPMDSASIFVDGYDKGSTGGDSTLTFLMYSGNDLQTFTFQAQRSDYAGCTAEVSFKPGISISVTLSYGDLGSEESCDLTPTYGTPPVIPPGTLPNYNVEFHVINATTHRAVPGTQVRVIDKKDGSSYYKGETDSSGVINPMNMNEKGRLSVSIDHTGSFNVCNATIDFEPNEVIVVFLKPGDHNIVGSCNTSTTPATKKK
ncbi:MAG: hypothetical protein WCO52_00360 [bacterium]